jgi:hypothetical protein
MNGLVHRPNDLPLLQQVERQVASGQQWLEKVRQKPVTVTAADEAALRELRASQGTGKVRLISRRRFGVNDRGNRVAVMRTA